MPAPLPHISALPLQPLSLLSLFLPPPPSPSPPTPPPQAMKILLCPPPTVGGKYGTPRFSPAPPPNPSPPNPLLLLLLLLLLGPPGPVPCILLSSERRGRGGRRKGCRRRSGRRGSPSPSFAVRPRAWDQGSGSYPPTPWRTPQSPW